ncbi:MAG: hypothetical protein ABIU09_06730, partial [Pyrinomonadaceae bacterium]
MNKKAVVLSKILGALLVVFASMTVFAQKRKPTTAPKKATDSTQAQIDTPEVVPPAAAPPKKNERPEGGQDRMNKRPSTASNPASEASFVPAYHYEFSQPEFIVSKIMIEHDETGKGKLSFMKKGYEDLISDPVQLSPKTLEKINEALTALNFIASNESYQYEKDYSHLGTVVFRLTRDGKTRNTTFNWTQNKNAKLLADEYRKISNQFIWMFDISLARENQPLESPKLMDSLDSMIRRNEISDPNQMVPFLQALVNDERIPL